jgi:sirohydrochlorin cobaltochelatase
MNTYHDAALVLAGHGSTVNPQSSAPIRQLVTTFRRNACFARVLAGFWKEDPTLSSVLQGVTEKRVFIMPFFVSAGYFTEELVPLQLGFRSDKQDKFQRVQKRGGQTFFYGNPVGTHDSMTNVILSRARSVVANHPFPRIPPEREITLLIAAHGTPLNRQSRESVERQVALIRQQGLYADVHAAFMEEAPQIDDWRQFTHTRHMVMVPFFLSDGLHVVEDIPVMLGQPERVVRKRLQEGRPTWRNPTEVGGKLVWYSGAVGSDPIVAEVILERVQEAASWPVSCG